MSDVSFDDEVTFEQARAFAAPYFPKRSYFADWILEALYSFRRCPSPFDYAARVGIAQKMLGELDHDQHKTVEFRLRRIIRNLFPYKQNRAGMNRSLARLLVQDDAERLDLKRPGFAPLNDALIPSKQLVEARYAILSSAFAEYARVCVANLREQLGEEEIDIPMHGGFVEYHLDRCMPLCDEIEAIRKKMFDDFPGAELRSVSEETIQREGEQQAGLQIGRSGREGQFRKRLAELEDQVHTELYAIMRIARHAIQEIDEKHHTFQALLTELVHMGKVIREYLDDQVQGEIDESLQTLHGEIEAKFAYDLYLPKDLVQQVEAQTLMYRDGWL